MCMLQVWIIYGDGSLGYSVAEYDTFTRHKVGHNWHICTCYYKYILCTGAKVFRRSYSDWTERQSVFDYINLFTNEFKDHNIFNIFHMISTPYVACYVIVP